MKKTAEQPGIMEKLAGGLLLALTFLMPLKFGTLAVMPEATGLYPGDLFSWAIISWPAHSFGLFSGGLLLLLAPAAFRCGRELFSTPAGRTALLWGVGLPAVSLIGWINAATFDYALGETAHLAGIGAYVLAVYLMLARRPEWRAVYWGVLAGGMLCLAASGLYQYFWGFRETREFLEYQMESGAAVSAHMQLKIASDTRVFATFVSCNALAGYLLILMPLTVVMADRWARRFEPVKPSRIIFCGVAGAMVSGTFLLARSRGSYLALVMAAALLVLALPMRRLYRMILILLAVLIVAGGAVYIKAAGRGFASMEERVSYLNTSARMLAEKPLAGYGWGGFFYRHMQLKTTDSDESAHDPHNLVASFAAQTGVAGLAVVLAAILYPMFLIGRRVLGRKPEEGEWPLFALFWGEVAFFLHAMMEINLQIPATMAVAGAGLVSALITEERPETSPVPAVRLGGAALPVLAALAALWLNFRWIDAELKFDRLLSYARPMSAEDQKRPPHFTAVARLLRENDAAKPYSPFPWEAAGDYYLRFGDVPAAEHCYREALKRSECRPAIYRRLFEIEYARGDREAARKSLKRMYELFPTNPRYRELVERHFPELLAPSR